MMSPIFIDTQLQNPYTPTHKKELFANQNSHTKRSLLMMESLIRAPVEMEEAEALQRAKQLLDDRLSQRR